jgi:transcriptional regulator with XRE-family HTH domain
MASTPQRSIPRSSIERSAARHARETRTRLATDLRMVREDACLSLSRLASVSGLAKSYVHAIESGRIEPSWDAVSRLATVLGGVLWVRYYPGTGPLVRDHIQAAIISAFLGILDERWRPRPEVAVYRPVRGVIDLVLDSADDHITIACEAQSELRRLEQQIRWSRAKADALWASHDLGSAGGGSIRVGRLLLLRSTPRTRAAVAEYADLVAAAYPASTIDAYHALIGNGQWPGDALLWCRVDGGRATVLERPPRGIPVGR